MSLTKSAMALLANLVLALPVLAQGAPTLPLQADEQQFVLQTFEQDISMPLPDWLELQGATPDTLLDRVSVHFREDEAESRLDIYPRGEGEALWSRLYGARFFRQPNLTLNNLRSAIINVYSQTCRPDAVALFQLEPDDGDNIPPLGFVCGAYLDLPGYSGQGEVMIMGFYRSASGVATIYQEWRGPAFDPQDTASWPVPSETVETRFSQFKSEAGFASAD